MTTLEKLSDETWTLMDANFDWGFGKRLEARFYFDWVVLFF